MKQYKIPKEIGSKKIKWLHHYLWKYYISIGYTSYEAKMIAWEYIDRYNFEENEELIEDDLFIVDLEELIRKPKR